MLCGGYVVHSNVNKLKDLAKKKHLLLNIKTNTEPPDFQRLIL